MITIFEDESPHNRNSNFDSNNFKKSITATKFERICKSLKGFEEEHQRAKVFRKKMETIVKITGFTWLFMSFSMIALTAIGFSQQNQTTGYKCLKCSSSACLCKANQHWDGVHCSDTLSYNNGICLNDSQCASNLICRLNDNSCSCPTSVPIGYCDCPTRVYGIEYYWNGQTCVEASSYNQTCQNFNYTCKIQTEQTQCDTVAGVCNCGPYGLWNFTKCIFCPSDWTLYKGSCFRTGRTPRNLVNTICPNCVAWIRDLNCYGQQNSKIAVLDNTDFNNLFLTASNGFSNYTWLDAYRDASDPFVYYALKTVSIGKNVTADPNWENYYSLITPYQCAVWNSVTRQLAGSICNQMLPILCEFILV